MGFLDGYNKISDPLDLWGKQASDRAADAQAEGAGQALQFQKDMWGRLREQEAPVRDFRDWAIGLINDYQGGKFEPTPDPGSAYRLQQTEEGINAAAAARGKFESGGRVADIQSARAGSASDTYNTGLNRLLNLAGYSVGDLNQNNNTLLNATAGVTSAMGEVGDAEQWGRTASNNSLVNMVNQGGYLAGYLGGGGRTAAPTVTRSPGPSTRYTPASGAY